MGIVKTPAIVLKSDKYRETSKIVTLFTRIHGKIRCIAKGVRMTNTKWGGCLQSLAYLNVFFYYKENRTLYLLSNAEYIETYKNLQSDNDKLRIAYHIAELLNGTTLEHHDNYQIFELIVESFRCLDNATKNYVNVLFKFEIELAGLLGFAIDSTEINSFARRVESNEMGNNQNITINAGGTDRNVYRNLSGLINQFKNGNFSDIMEFNIMTSESKNLGNLLNLYYMEHIENSGIFKTKRIIKS